MREIRPSGLEGGIKVQSLIPTLSGRYRDHEGARTRDSVRKCGGPPPLGNRRFILMTPI